MKDNEQRLGTTEERQPGPGFLTQAASGKQKSAGGAAASGSRCTDGSEGTDQELARAGTVVEDDTQPERVKFELDRAVEAGIDLQPFAGMTDTELRQIRLAYENGVGEALAAIVRGDPGQEQYNNLQMEIIRLGLEEDLPVGCYARPDYDSNQMWQIYLALRDGLPARRLQAVDPARYPDGPEHYSADQMRELRLGLIECLDITAFDDPALSAVAMRELRLRVQQKEQRTPLQAFKQVWNERRRQQKNEKRRQAEEKRRQKQRR